MRKCGVLCAISSLPSNYGIGSLGESAYEFVDLIKTAGIKIWQLLPINPYGSGNSPYSSICGFAIEPALVSLEMLAKDNLIKGLKKFKSRSKRVDFKSVRKFKEKYLREAFNKQKDTKSVEFLEFLNNDWIVNYAMFSVLYKENHYKNWNDWDAKYKNALDNGFNFGKYAKEIEYYEWVQFILYKQFKLLKDYANKNGIELMGDVPFYVGENSSEVWSNKTYFMLNEDGHPAQIAGVPPDYFCSDGQRWGNPIYNWKEIKKNNYSFWIKRIKNLSSIYDLLRIDHFRAFDSYYEIDSKSLTAKNGIWRKGYGKQIFKFLKKEKLSTEIIAEDLGTIFPSVIELREYLKLKGMNVFEFHFLSSDFLEKKNQVIYTGTHDNETLKGWINNLNEGEKEMLDLTLSYKGYKKGSIFSRVQKYVINSKCEYAILPIQDYLALDNFSRMNTPGTCGSPNWEFKLVSFSKLKKKISSINKLIKEGNR